MSEYTSYYLFQKYEKKGDGQWTPVYPPTYSIYSTGEEGGYTKVKNENDTACGYSEDKEPIYQWVQTNDTSCNGYDLHWVDKKQVSYNGGVSYQDTYPLETRLGSLKEENSTDCGGVKLMSEWRVVEGDYYCDDTTKKQKLRLYESRNNGVSWTATDTYSTGATIETLSRDCGYSPKEIDIDNAYATSDFAVEYTFITPPHSTAAANANAIADGSNFHQAKLGFPVDGRWDNYASGEIYTPAHYVQTASWTEPIGTTTHNFNETYCLTSECGTMRNPGTEYGFFTFIDDEIIPSYAFNGAPIAAIESGYAEEIADYGFASCFGEGSTKIDNWTYGLQKADLRGLKKLGNYSFYNNPYLGHVALSDDLEYIGCNVFDSCDALVGIYYYGTQAQWDSIEKCDNWKGDSTAELNIMGEQVPTTYVDRDGIKTTSYDFGTFERPSSFRKKGQQVGGYEYQLTNIHIGNTVYAIGDEAFSSAKYVTSLTFSDSVTEIGNYAFNGLESITELNLPKTLTTLSKGAFQYCTSLTSVIIPKSIKSIDAYVFQNCTSLTNVTYEGTMADWVKVKKVKYWNGRYYDYKDMLDDYPMAATVVHCSDGDVDVATGQPLTPITATDDFTIFTDADGKDYYFYVSTITGSSYSDSVSITGVTKVVIGNIVNNIGWDAFTGGYELNDIYFNGTMADWCNVAKSSGSNWYYGVPTGIIHCTDGDCDLVTCDGSTHCDTRFYDADGVMYSLNTSYISKDTYSYYMPNPVKVEVGSCCQTIEMNAFAYVSSLKEVTFQEGLTKIDKYGFQGCTGLTSISFPKSISTLGENSFEKCSNLTNVNYAGTVEDWCNIPTKYNWAYNVAIDRVHCTDGDAAKNGCTPIEPEKPSAEDYTTYVDTDGVEHSVWIYGELSKDKLADDYSTIASVKVGNKVTSIPQFGFNGCDSLTSFTFNDSITSISSYAFQYTGLETISTWPNSINTITKDTYYNCDSLTTVIIPNNVTSIGEWAFGECDILDSVTIPNSVTSIGNYAFAQCSKLTSITYEGTIAEWNAISKGSNWIMQTSLETIHCTDGDITL